MLLCYFISKSHQWFCFVLLAIGYQFSQFSFVLVVSLRIQIHNKILWRLSCTGPRGSFTLVWNEVLPNLPLHPFGQLGVCKEKSNMAKTGQVSFFSRNFFSVFSLNYIDIMFSYTVLVSVLSASLVVADNKKGLIPNVSIRIVH